MGYSEFTHNSPIGVQRFSHRSRFAKAMMLGVPKPGEKVLDVGTGDAAFPLSLWLREPKAEYVAYDPDPLQYAQALRTVGMTKIVATRSLPNLQFDLIFCLETLEHVADLQVPSLLAQIRGMLKANAKLIVSVPIELGLSALGKQAVRALGGQRERIATLRNIAVSAIGRPDLVARDQNKPGHTGFDYRELERRFSAAGLSVLERHFGPLPLGPILNSQVFWILEPVD